MYLKYFKLIKFFVLLCAFTSLSTHITLAQNEQKIDSLKHLLSVQTDEEGKCDVLYYLAREYAYSPYSNNQLALECANQGYEYALQLGDSLRITRFGRLNGQLLRLLDRTDESIEAFQHHLAIAERHKNLSGYNDEYKAILNGLAIAYTFQANYDEALECHFKSLIEREREGNKKEISVALNNIGLVYFKLKNYERALEYYSRSYEMKKLANDKFDLDRLFINIALCYNQLKEFDRAKDFFNRGFKECGENCDVQIKIEGKFGLGVAHYFLQDYEVAKSFLQESYELSKQTSIGRFQADNLVYLSHLNLRLGKPEAALAVLKEAEKIASHSGYNELLIEVYRDFFKLYNQEMDFEQASYYQSKYIKLKDSIYSDKLIKNLARVQTDYEERQNIAIIASKEEALIRQKRFNIAVAIIAVLAGSLVFVLYRSNLVKKRVNQDLSDAKATIEDQNRQLTTLNRNLEKMVDARTMELQIANEALKRVNDELDNFIYKTSHDIRGPLASLRGICNVAIMDVKDSLALDYFSKLDATAEKLNTILTRLLIINQINNSSASHELIDFQEIVNEVIVLEKKRGLPPKLSIRSDIDENITFYSDKELIRIILENLIDNAIKFYNDSDRIDPFVEIRVMKEGMDLKISVIDNGIGISQVNPDKIFQIFSRASERSGTGGIGLYLTKTATEKIGGHIDLKTTPEGFTEFFVKFSINTSKMRRAVTF